MLLIHGLVNNLLCPIDFLFQDAYLSGFLTDCPESFPKTAWTTGQIRPKSFPEAALEKPKIVNKPGVNTEKK